MRRRDLHDAGLAQTQIGADCGFLLGATCRPLLRPSDAELDRIAQVLDAGTKIAIYGGSGCDGAHDEIIALADLLKAPVAHTSRAKDFLEYDNPFDVGMTGVLGVASGYHALMDCDTLLLLGCDFAWRQFYPDKARIVQIDIDPTHLGPPPSC